VRRLDPGSPFGVLVLPSPHPVSTADVYREADRLGLPRSAADLEEWRATLGAPQAMITLFNDLEAAARALCPSIDAALADARAAGARVAMVSGSGPTVFGLFPGEALAKEAADALRDRHPGARAASPVGAEAGRVEAA
jgi:4-diphosphocytidyl-2-C-methyl-D-erythritol kinase